MKHLLFRCVPVFAAFVGGVILASMRGDYLVLPCLFVLAYYAAEFAREARMHKQHSEYWQQRLIRHWQLKAERAINHELQEEPFP